MYYFVLEAVSAGHPDKCTDVIADSILDRLLKLDSAAKVAIEVFISGKHIIIGGEVKFKAGHFDEDSIIFYINNTGRYITHLPIADSSLTGRKVVCDTYGSYAPIGGGAQSSKKYTKVDRSVVYAAKE